MWAAGEYNLRLGITKELHPDMVATYQGMHSHCHAYQACENLRLCLDPMMQCYQLAISCIEVTVFKYHIGVSYPEQMSA